jgi:hypothetical protein
MRSTRFVAAVLLAAFLPACTSYQVMADPASGLQAQPKPIKEARVTLKNGSVFELDSPRVDGDSLRGNLEGRATSMPWSDVAGVEVRRTSAVKTTALVVGVGLFAVAAGVAIAYAICPDTSEC